MSSNTHNVINSINQLKQEVSQKGNQTIQKVSDIQQKVSDVKQEVSVVKQEVSNLDTKIDTNQQSNDQQFNDIKTEINALKAEITTVKNQTEPEKLWLHQRWAKSFKDKSIAKIDSWTGVVVDKVKVIVGIVVLVGVIAVSTSGYWMDYINNARSINEKPETPIVQQVSPEKEDKPSTSTAVPEDIQVHLNAIADYTEKTAEENASLKKENESLINENESLKEENEKLKNQIEESNKQEKNDIQK
jgi:peptidoglycan hydrolase CwlO-like protein